MAPFKVAVLDDYSGRSESIFKALDASKFEVAFYKDTLLPYNHPDTPQEEKDKLVQRLLPFDIISVMRERTPFPAELVDRLPNLKLLLSTGMRNLGLDLEAFRRRGIPVAGAAGHGGPATGPDSTTQHIIAMILAVARNLAADDLSVKTGGWQTDLAFGLAGKVYGVVGLGRLGMSSAKILHQAFGMKVIAWSPHLSQDKADQQARAAGLPAEQSHDGSKTFTAVSREELFRRADVLAIHIPLSDRSWGLITKNDLTLLKQDSIFVNTARGPIVVEEDLLDVLEEGRIGRAAIDVFAIEPLPAHSRWRTTKWGQDGRSQVLLSPHMGYGERATMEAWYQAQVDNLVLWEKGQDLVDRLV